MAFNISENKFNSYMIVYEKNEKRLENYENVKNLLKCEKFSAIDTINFYEKYADFALKNKYTIQRYLNLNEKFPGKLGCNLSHQLLLEQILKESSTDWNLILEDDVCLNNFNLDELNELLEIANMKKSNYIQLYTNPQHINKQKIAKQINNNLYEMIYQSGTLAYFINKKGINILINKYPLEKNIDFVYSGLIRPMKSLCWLNNTFINMGSVYQNDKSNSLGSIIWDNKK